MDFNYIQRTFHDPEPMFRPVPFWFWNSKLDPEEIRRQVHLIHEAGLGGFFMHARFGLETEYMSEQWLECIKVAVNTARECGIYAWLYDEYPFPSGVGGLKVTQNPDHCNKFIDIVEVVADGPKTMPVELTEGIPLLSYMIPEGKFTQFKRSAIKLKVEPSKSFNWHVPEGKWQLIIFIERTLQDPRGNVFGPNYLDQSTTEAFLKIISKYEELKEHFGKTIPGIFTDEPCLLAWHQDHTNYPVRANGRIVPWSKNIPMRLKNMGYDWEDVLPAVFYDLGEESKELRLIYRKAVADEYIEDFFIPYRNWCDKNKLKLTGHLLLEEGLYTNTIFQGDFMEDLSYFDIPGTDHLGIGCEAEYGGWGNIPLMSTNIQGQKTVSSVSHLYGKEATLSESFGVSGWGLTLSDMKRIVDWQYQLGINFLCPHAFYYSLEGFRKHDSPPSQFFQATYWRYYKCFSDYVGRLSLLMRAGHHVAQASLIYPKEAFWKTFIAGQENEIDKMISDQFNLYSSNLMKCHVDYDIVPEHFISPQNIDDGHLVIANEKYELMIIPSIVPIPDRMLNAILKFYEGGGKLLLTSPVCGNLLEQVNSKASPKGSYAIIDSLDITSLSPTIDKLITRNVYINHPEVTYVQRRVQDKDIYFFFNNGDRELKAQISVKGSGHLQKWDLETGEILDLSYATNSDRINFEWEFQGHESLLVVLDPQDRANRKKFEKEEFRILRILDDLWQFEIESPNALILDNWNLHISTKGDWIIYNYQTDVEFDHIPAQIYLMLDDVESRRSFMSGMRFKILVNESEVSQSSHGYYIDPGWKTFDIRDKVKLGKNQIQLTFINQSWCGEPKPLTMPPKLLGEFALSSNAEGKYTISEPKRVIRSGMSWTEQGYPYYSGTAIYSKIVSFSEDELREKEIWIETPEVADVVEFIINGIQAVVRPWRPYRCKITHLLRAGENTITIKVTNSMKNFIEKEPKASGILREVRLLSTMLKCF